MNAYESLAYLAQQCPSIFGPIKEEFERLKQENKKGKEVILGLGKQLSEEKLERINNVNKLNLLGKEIVETKLNLLGGK